MFHRTDTPTLGPPNPLLTTLYTSFMLPACVRRCYVDSQGLTLWRWGYKIMVYDRLRLQGKKGFHFNGNETGTDGMGGYVCPFDQV